MNFISQDLILLLIQEITITLHKGNTDMLYRILIKTLSCSVCLFFLLTKDNYLVKPQPTATVHRRYVSNKRSVKK